MGARTVKFLPPVPLDRVPAPWKQALSLLDRSSPPLPFYEPAIQVQVDISDADWRVALYWVVKKKWNPKLRIPIPAKVSRLYESWGELLYRCLELCVVCFNSGHLLSKKYPHAADWFLNVIQEAKNISTSIVVRNEPIGKVPIIEERRRITAQLRDLRNPANPQTSPHYYRLNEVAFFLEKDDVFNKTYWQPLLSAACKWTQAIEKPTYQETFVKGNRIYYRAGRGRGTLTLLSLN